MLQHTCTSLPIRLRGHTCSPPLPRDCIIPAPARCVSLPLNSTLAAAPPSSSSSGRVSPSVLAAARAAAAAIAPTFSMGRDRRDSNEDRDRLAAADAGGMSPPRRVTRTVLAAVVLFTVGSLFLVYGVHALATAADYDRGVAMVVIGTITFLPGIYACTVIAGTLLGWPGYDVRDLPSYDDN